MDFTISTPYFLYPLLGLYSTLIFYMRKADRSVMMANIFSSLHIMFYIFVAYSLNIFSALILFVVAEIISFVFVHIESSLLANKYGDDVSIQLISKFAPFVNVMIVLMVIFGFVQ